MPEKRLEKCRDINRELNRKLNRVTRVWTNDCGGHYIYSCGCLQFQDGYELCPKHQLEGYISLLADADLV